MLSCHDVSKLLSESADRELPLWTRINMRMHLILCRACAQGEKQLSSLRELLRKHEKAPMCLSEETKAKMKKTLQ
jgi:putative zinc finger protein